MTVELNAEQERIVQRQLAGGEFKSVAEVLSSALQYLPLKPIPRAAAVERMLEFSRMHSTKLPPGETVEDLVRQGHRH